MAQREKASNRIHSTKVLALDTGTATRAALIDRGKRGIQSKQNIIKRYIASKSPNLSKKHLQRYCKSSAYIVQVPSRHTHISSDRLVQHVEVVQKARSVRPRSLRNNPAQGGIQRDTS